MDTERENTKYGGNFAIISYSYEELTIIQTYSNSSYLEGIDEYIPKYFLRFDIPLTEKLERHIKVYWLNIGVQFLVLTKTK